MRRVVALASVALAAVGLCADATAGEPASGLVWGTGFVVDWAGHLLTANHVVAACARIEIVSHSEREDADAVATSASDDLALLRVARPVGIPLSFDAGDRVSGGALVTVLGYEALAGRGITSPAPRLISNGMALDAGLRRLTLISDAMPGASGSPVIDINERVVGVLVSMRSARGAPAYLGGSRDVRIAVSGLAAKHFLLANGIAPLESDRDSGIAAAATILASAEVRVECFQGLGLQSESGAQVP